MRTCLPVISDGIGLCKRGKMSPAARVFRSLRSFVGRGLPRTRSGSRMALHDDCQTRRNDATAAAAAAAAAANQ